MKSQVKSKADQIRERRPLYLSMEEGAALRRAPGWEYATCGGECHSWQRRVGDWHLDLHGYRRQEGWSWTLWVWVDGHRLQWLHSAVKAKTPAGAMLKAQEALRKFFADQAKALQLA